MSRSVRFLLALAIPAAIHVPVPSAGGRLGGGTPIDRGGNTMNMWCPNSLYQTVEFTADGSQATIIFTAQTHSSIQFPICEALEDSSVCYMHQSLDNVMVVPKSIYLANLDPKYACLFPELEDVFRFDLVPPGDFLLQELFDTGIGPEWEVNRGYYDPANSAPVDLSPQDLNGLLGTGGSLDFGLAGDAVDCSSVPPTADCVSYASAVAHVTGLQAGTEYMLVYWWSSAVDYSCCTGPWEASNGDLFVDIYGADTICSITGPDPVCQGSANTYTASLNPPGGTVSYTWSILGDGHIVGSASGSSVLIQAENAGSYSLTLDVVQNGVPGSCLMVVTVDPEPTCAITGPTAVCTESGGHVYQASVSPSGGTVTYSWSVSGNGTIIGSTSGSSVTLTAASAGSFSLTLDVTRNGCASACILVVTVSSSPACDITGPSSLCPGTTDTYVSTVIPPGGAVTYSWSASGDGAIVGSATGSSVNVRASVAGSLTLTLETTRDGCPGICQLLIPVLGGVLSVPFDYPTIQAAIDAASETGPCGSDTVEVAGGVYTGPGNQNLNFLGKDIVVRSASGPGSTTIDCGGSTSGALFVSGEGNGAVLDGFTIRNAVNSAIRATSASPTIRNCILRNGSSSLGGAVNLSSSSARFFECDLRGNQATTHGGGVYVAGSISKPFFQNCLISGNLAAALGGGFYATSGSDPVLIGCTISANRAMTSGGGIRSFGSGTTVVADSSVVWGNCADGTYDEIAASTGTAVTAHCSVVDTAGIGGGGAFSLVGSYIDEDPLFCDPTSCAEAPTSEGDFSVHAASVAAYGNNACGTFLGALGVGCTYEVASIEDVGNDQGRQVRLKWYRSPNDQAGVAQPVTGYSLWRRVVVGLASGPATGAGRHTLAGAAFPPGEWDFVQLVPAYAEAKYSTVVPTLCDSTTGGICWSTFFIRTQTAIPSIYADTAPDSGYSVDNLAPGSPGLLTLSANRILGWNESEDADFDHFNVYGSSTGAVTGGVLIGQTSLTTLDVTGSVYPFYHVTAMDRSGNEGPGARQISVGSVPTGSMVGVNLGPDVLLTFEAVGKGGDATLSPTPDGPPAPSGILVVPSAHPVFYDVTTDAGYAGEVEVSIGYRPSDLAGPEENLLLFHYDETVGGGSWRDITTEVDLTGKVVRGRTASLSAFALVEGGSPTAIGGEVRRPLRLLLHPGFPNPFYGATRVRFDLPEPAVVTLQVMDTTGRLVRTLVNGVQFEAGSYEEIWDGRDGAGRAAAAGVYFYRLDVPSRILVQKGVLLR